MQNGSFDHLIGQLDRRLERIEITLDRLVDQNDERHEKLNGRVAELEQTRAKAQGGWTVITIVGSIAGAIGGYASKWLG